MSVLQQPDPDPAPERDPYDDSLGPDDEELEKARAKKKQARD